MAPLETLSKGWSGVLHDISIQLVSTSLGTGAFQIMLWKLIQVAICDFSL